MHFYFSIFRFNSNFCFRIVNKITIALKRVKPGVQLSWGITLYQFFINIRNINDRFTLPILDLDDAFPFEVLQQFIDELSEEEFAKFIEDNSNDLPETIKSNPTKQGFNDLMRSGFFQQSKANLSNHLKRNNGSGFLLAQLFKLNYQGEGIGNFLQALRKSNHEKK